MRSIALALMAGVLLSPSGLLHPSAAAGQSTGAQTAEQQLQGAWQVMQLGGDDAPRPGPEWWTPPGLLLFAGNHYSYTLLTRPRPEMPSGIPTANDLLQVWSPLTANAGTFEVVGDTLTRRPMVAKSPDAMGAGVFNRYTFRLSADTLWITTLGTETGPDPSPTTVRYQRLR